jgi:hypothetical protein
MEYCKRVNEICGYSHTCDKGNNCIIDIRARRNLSLGLTEKGYTQKGLRTCNCEDYPCCGH